MGIDGTPMARRNFAADTRGATAVEFALVAVPFLGLLMAIFQAGFAYFASENLQAATQSAARNLFIGTRKAPVSAPPRLSSASTCARAVVVRSPRSSTARS